MQSVYGAALTFICGEFSKEKCLRILERETSTLLKHHPKARCSAAMLLTGKSKNPFQKLYLCYLNFADHFSNNDRCAVRKELLCLSECFDLFKDIKVSRPLSWA